MVFIPLRSPEYPLFTTQALRPYLGYGKGSQSPYTGYSGPTRYQYVILGTCIEV